MWGSGSLSWSGMGPVPKSNAWWTSIVYCKQYEPLLVANKGRSSGRSWVQYNQSCRTIVGVVGSEFRLSHSRAGRLLWALPLCLMCAAPILGSAAIGAAACPIPSLRVGSHGTVPWRIVPILMLDIVVLMWQPVSFFCLSCVQKKVIMFCSYYLWRQ